MSLTIHARHVLAWDGADHRLVEDGTVVVDGDTLTYVGPRDGAPPGGDGDEVLDAGDALVAPGFVDLNALGDVDHHLIVAAVPTERADELQWSRDFFAHRRREQMSADDEAAKSRYAYAALLLNGITTAMPITSTIPKLHGETFAEVAAAAGHAADLGLRVYLGPGYLQGKHVRDDLGGYSVRLFDEDVVGPGLAAAERFIEEFEGAAGGLVRTCVVPERVELQTIDSLRASKELARRRGVPMRLHAAQGVFEYRYIRDRTGLSPIRFLDSLGLLDEGTFVPHAHLASGHPAADDAGDADLDVLRDTGTTVIHCPQVQARWGEALHSFGRYTRHGISMAMGTDTWPADMVENCRLGSYVSRILDADSPESGFASFYRAATVGGADALGRPDLGRLAAGCRADLVVFDQTGFDQGVAGDPLAQLMISGSGRSVRTVVVDGRVVVRDREIPGVDLADLQRIGQGIHDRMAASYVERSDRPGRSPREFFSPLFG